MISLSSKYANRSQQKVIGCLRYRFLPGKNCNRFAKFADSFLNPLFSPVISSPFSEVGWNAARLQGLDYCKFSIIPFYSKRTQQCHHSNNYLTFMTSKTNIKKLGIRQLKMPFFCNYWVEAAGRCIQGSNCVADLGLKFPEMTSTGKCVEYFTDSFSF